MVERLHELRESVISEGGQIRIREYVVGLGIVLGLRDLAAVGLIEDGGGRHHGIAGRERDIDLRRFFLEGIPGVSPKRM